MALGPFTAEAASNLPSGPDAHRLRLGVHLTTSAPFRVRAYARIRPVIRDGRRRNQPSCPGFPLPFGYRRSLLGHPLPAGELGLPCGRLTGPCCQGRTPTGLSRSARMSCGRGGCPLYPGDCGARTAGRSSPAAARRLAAARPCTPVQQPTTGGFLSRGIIKGSQSFTRPAFPSPVTPGWNGSPRAFPPGFTPRRYRRRMPGWGQASWALT